MGFRRSTWVLQILLSVVSLFGFGCARELTECEGPALNTASLNSLKTMSGSSDGPRAFLVLPNPIDATGIRTVQASDSRVSQAGNAFGLFGLEEDSSLGNDFLNVRLHSLTDDPSTLAQADGNGDFKYSVTDPHYGEVLAYHSISTALEYVQTLGFSLVKSRPIVVMTQYRSNGQVPSSVNAFYDHSYLNPSQPRMMKVSGEGQYAPSMDRDIFWHEIGHYVNESISNETGMDYAGDNAAVFTEGSALHECLADYLAESLSNRGYVGRWIARNFPDITAGDPLRRATDVAGGLKFTDVIKSDGKTNFPERYKVAEWCSRVLWDIRTQFAKENPKTGPIVADRFVYSAVSMLQKDSSLSDFRNALQASDQELHCGLHKTSISKAFEGRGFAANPDTLRKKLTISAVARAVNETANGYSAGSMAPGATIAFEITIKNPNTVVGRNVRIHLESKSSAFRATTYQQGLGDIHGGVSLSIGNSGVLSFDNSVFGKWVTGASASSVPYRIRVLVENGPETVFDGDLLK